MQKTKQNNINITVYNCYSYLKVVIYSEFKFKTCLPIIVFLVEVGDRND